MAPALFSRLAVAALLLSATPVMADDIDLLPVTAIFVVSGGFWEEIGETAGGEESREKAETPAKPEAPEEAARRGYYKLVAIRQPDRTAKIYLQQIALGDAGPQLAESVELEEFSMIKPYVTDIRPEDSTGVSRQPGFFATVYLKTDPAAVEPESWTVLIDEFGEIKVEKATN